MSSGAERTVNPSRSRLQQAAEEGYFAHSSDFVLSAVMLSSFATLYIYADTLMAKFSEIMRSAFDFQILLGTENQKIGSGVMLEEIFGSLPMIIVQIVGPVLLIILLTSVACSWLQSPRGIRVDVFPMRSGTWNPLHQWRNLFSLKTTGRLCFQVVRLCMVVWVFMNGFQSLVAEVGDKAVFGLERKFELIHVATTTIFQVCLVILTFAVLDGIYRRWSWWNSMKMTPQEAKDEYREKYGDPRLRHRRRRFQHVLRDSLIRKSQYSRTSLERGSQ